MLEKIHEQHQKLGTAKRTVIDRGKRSKWLKKASQKHKEESSEF